MALEYLKIHPADSVAVAIVAIARGARLSVDGVTFAAACDVPVGHKIALRAIDEGAVIRKYGHVIGHATRPIAQGEWVHAQNMATNLSDAADYTYNPLPRADAETADAGELPAFWGYRRKDGRVGTRNEIWIVNTVGCVNTSAERIARLANERFRREGFDGVYAFSHPFGCSQLGGDLEKTQALLRGLMRNPNAGGVLVLGLGCENNQLKQFLEGAPEPERLRSFNAQEVSDEIEEGIARVGELFELMKNDAREELPISALTLGMKCGGSDGFSGITANPLVGCITDRLTALGGRVILTEVPEMFGAEQQLMNRAVNDNVYRDIVRLIGDFKAYFTAHNQPVYENPSPGNKSGGITTLEEKSLGAIQKGGTARVHEVLAYGQPISTPHGMALLNAPGNDGVSATAMTASGATMILFTTGRGTPLGFPVPTVKISTNSALKANKPNWIDFDAGALLDGSTTMEDLARGLLSFIIDAASGRTRTKNEMNGYKEIAIWKEGVTL